MIGGVGIAINQFRHTDLAEGGIVYDAENDRYFDPAHGHWHEGRPPQGVAAQPAAGATPEPWEYDAANDRIWLGDLLGSGLFGYGRTGAAAGWCSSPSPSSAASRR